MPASAETANTGAGKEDHVSMGGFAARKAVQVASSFPPPFLSLSISVSLPLSLTLSESLRWLRMSRRFSPSSCSLWFMLSIIERKRTHPFRSLRSFKFSTRTVPRSPHQWSMIVTSKLTSRDCSIISGRNCL
jgi:hypothetical protein